MFKRKLGIILCCAAITFANIPMHATETSGETFVQDANDSSEGSTMDNGDAQEENVDSKNSDGAEENDFDQPEGIKIISEDEFDETAPLIGANGEEIIPDSERMKTSTQAVDEDIAEEMANQEPVEWPDTEKYGGYNTYQEYLDSKAQTELTPEQEAAGMILNEYGQVEDPNESDAYGEVIYGGVNPGKNTGYVDIQLTTDLDIHEEIYVNVSNLNTAKIYGCRLYEINNYATQMCLPAGHYIIMEAGPTLDAKGRFYTYNRQFEVKKDAVELLEVPLYDSQAPAEEESAENTVTNADTSAETPVQDNTIQPQQSNTPITTGTVEEAQLVEKQKFPILSILAAIIIVGGMFLLLKKLFPPKKKTEWKGFD